MKLPWILLVGRCRQCAGTRPRTLSCCAKEHTPQNQRAILFAHLIRKNRADCGSATRPVTSWSQGMDCPRAVWRGGRSFPLADGHKLKAAKRSNRTPDAVISFHHMSGWGPCLDGSRRAMACPSLTASTVEGALTPLSCQAGGHLRLIVPSACNQAPFCRGESTVGLTPPSRHRLLAGPRARP
jgi:hypothetical protein